jgi:hypothetical protein
MAAVHVTVMAPMMAISPPVAVVGAFIERKFVAHADIKFAHKSPRVCAAATGRKENIII